MTHLGKTYMHKGTGKRGKVVTILPYGVKMELTTGTFMQISWVGLRTNWTELTEY
jgi:hypothetical protein